jgi:hypothetical protein
MLAAMFMRIAASAVWLVLIAGCGLSYPPAPHATPSPISTAPTGQPSQTSSVLPTPAPLPTGPSAEIEVIVTGGDFDGSYRGVASDGCASEPEFNTFTVAYANDFAADDFIALDLVLRDAAQATEDASSDFLLQLSLSGADGGVSYTLDPVEGEGEGEAFLDVSSVDATLDLSITAPDGAIIEVTVICELV